MLRAGAFAVLAALALFTIGCKSCGNHYGHGGCGNGGCSHGYVGPAETLEPVPPANGGGAY